MSTNVDGRNDRSREVEEGVGAIVSNEGESEDDEEEVGEGVDFDTVSVEDAAFSKEGASFSKEGAAFDEEPSFEL